MLWAVCEAGGALEREAFLKFTLNEETKEPADWADEESRNVQACENFPEQFVYALASGLQKVVTDVSIQSRNEHIASLRVTLRHWNVRNNFSGIVADRTDVRRRLWRPGRTLGSAIPMLAKERAGFLASEVIIVLAQCEVEKS